MLEFFENKPKEERQNMVDSIRKNLESELLEAENNISLKKQIEEKLNSLNEMYGL